MAAVIPNLRIDPQTIHHARRKLQTQQKGGTIQFSADEREALLALIRRGAKRVYPTPVQLDAYQARIDKLAGTDPSDATFEVLIHQLEDFENKFCE